MKARDERVALMNEILGGIRMLKVLIYFAPSWTSCVILLVHGLGAQFREACIKSQGDRVEVPEAQLYH
jgi:hypothetical protein